jgi:hypothetical protein
MTSAQRRRRRLADLGEILMTLGLILMLFVGYQLWWTNVSAARTAEQAASLVQQSWAASTPPGHAGAVPPVLGRAGRPGAP